MPRAKPSYPCRADTVIRLGIVGSNYGRTVQLPAFRADPRCQVVALAGSDAGAHRRARPRGRRCQRLWRLARAGRGQGRAGGRHRHAAEPAGADRHPRARTRQAGVRREADGERSAKRARHAAAGQLKRPADHDRFQFHSDHGLAARQGDARRRRHRRAAPRHGALARREPRPAIAHAQLEDRRRRRRRRAGQFHHPLFPLSRMVLRADRRLVGAHVGPAGRRRVWKPRWRWRCNSRPARW